MKITKRIFSSSGMLWDDGDIPQCSYCQEDFDNVDQLSETPLSGDLVCESSECRSKMVENCLYNTVEEQTEEAEYECEMCEEEMTEEEYDFCDICGDCREEEN